MSNSELQSKVFDFLRFPLMVGVVFIHTGLTDRRGGYLLDKQHVGFELTQFTSNLFSETFGRLAVPLFFFISAYLFFYNCNFSKEVYLKKIKSRMKTLLIPYLFWNSLFLIYYVAKHILGASISIEASWLSFLSGYWAHIDTLQPLSGQFWFIRDLMVCVILSPIIYYIIKTTNFIMPLIFGILWVLSIGIPYLGARGLSVMALFFFSLGSFFSINKRNIVEEVSKISKWIYFVYIILALIDCTTRGLEFNGYLHRMTILFGMICCFKLAAYLIKNKGARMLPFLVSSSFFIFATHMPWMKMIAFRMFDSIVFPNDFSLTVFYFARVIFIVSLSLITYYILKRLFPQFTAVVTGGR